MLPWNIHIQTKSFSGTLVKRHDSRNFNPILLTSIWDNHKNWNRIFRERNSKPVERNNFVTVTAAVMWIKLDELDKYQGEVKFFVVVCTKLLKFPRVEAFFNAL